MPPRNIATSDRHQRQHARAAADDGDREVDQPQRHAGAVEDRADQHEHRDRQQRVLAEAGVEVLRHGQQAEPLRIAVGQRDAGRAGQAQRRADRHADQHQHDEGDEQQRGDHCAPSPVVGRGAPRRMNEAARARSAIADDTIGSQIEYHHAGTPMPGEVSSKR